MSFNKFLYFSIIVLFYLLLVIAIYWIHIKFFRVNVVFYSAIIDATLGALIVLIILLNKKLSLFNGFERVQILVVILLVGYAIAISVPTVIDRSLSFYILEKLEQRGGGIRQERMAEVFTEEYMNEHRLVDVRLTEQLQSGTIVIRDGCVLLTEEGRRLATFSRYFRQNWLPKQRLLMGEYTDALTDPFRTSPAVEDYKCN
jgi:hypothetical protein